MEVLGSEGSSLTRVRVPVNGAGPGGKKPTLRSTAAPGATESPAVSAEKAGLAVTRVTLRPTAPVLVTRRERNALSPALTEPKLRLRWSTAIFGLPVDAPTPLRSIAIE